MNPVGSTIQKLSQQHKQLRHAPRWVKISMWISSGILAVVVLLTVVGIITLRTTAFHNFLLNKAQTLASERLSSRVDLQNFTLHLSTLSLDIYGVTVHGAAPYVDPPG